MIRIAISQAAFDAIVRTMPFGSVNFEAGVDANGERYIWLPREVVDRLRALRGPGESFSDVYHVWWDPELLPQIARAGRDRPLAFHVCDWLVPTKDMLNDRGMMGDGVIDIKSVRSAVEAQGFAGYSEIEIFSSHWWEKPMDEVLQTCIGRHRSVV
jgi:sugar phosphate isomerase/epimerase